VTGGYLKSSGKGEFFWTLLMSTNIPPCFFCTVPSFAVFCAAVVPVLDALGGPSP